MELSGGRLGDAERPASCEACGWSGLAPDAARAEPGVDGADPFTPACPRCGAVLQPDMPSVDAIRAARRQPEG